MPHPDRALPFVLLLTVPWLAGADSCGGDVAVGVEPVRASGPDAGAPRPPEDGGVWDAGAPRPGTPDGGDVEAGAPAPDGGAAADAGQGEQCGEVVCSVGTVCCNPACGACTPTGGDCIQLVCGPVDPPVCERSDCDEAELETCGDGRLQPARCVEDPAGGCRWETHACIQLAPTVCQESDCPLPRPAAPTQQCGDGSTAGPRCVRSDQGACVWEVRECPASCGGIAGQACPDPKAQYCDYAIGEGCGVADGLGVCRPRPVTCLAVYEPVCTCDGRSLSSACAAASQGLSVRHPGLCEPRECEEVGGRVLSSDGSEVPACPNGEEDLGFLDAPPEGARCCR